MRAVVGGLANLESGREVTLAPAKAQRTVAVAPGRRARGKWRRSFPSGPVRGGGSIAGPTACAKTACNHELLNGPARILDPLIAWNAGKFESHPRFASFAGRSP